MYKDAFTTLTFLFFIRHFYIYLRLYQKVALEVVKHMYQKLKCIFH